MILGGTVYLAAGELRSSQVQAEYLSATSGMLTYRVKPGPSPSIEFPVSGPSDRRLGYVDLPRFVERLTRDGFEIKAQARMSPALARLSDLGLFATYKEKAKAGLRLRDRDDRNLFHTAFPQRGYQDFSAIPSLLLKTLLYIENRELLNDDQPYKNPAIEWDRFGRAALDVLMNKVGGDGHVTGGSTLATQIEKYRHSPGGRTGSIVEKFRQMASASLRAYLNGPDTSEARRAIALAYLNTVPLAAAPRFGEVHGLGDGLWVWYGRDLATVNELLSEAKLGTREATGREQAAAYRDTLALMLAQRRPTYYFGRGHAALQGLTDSYLRLLARDGVIPAALRDAALAIRSALRGTPVDPRQESLPVSKTETVLRTRLAKQLGVARLYDLDRLDLSVKSTIDHHAQQAVTGILRGLSSPSGARDAGLFGVRLFGGAEHLSEVVYSLTLFERSGKGNLLRIQTDNYNQPLDINEGVRLDLGSTAKLRTLVSYLEIIGDLYQKYHTLPAPTLRKISIHRRDHLSRWVIGRIVANPAITLPKVLDEALQRPYSAATGERFFTGGGLHTFANFNASDSGRVMPVLHGFRNSVNLVFIRLMRDIAYHHLYKPGATGAEMEKADSEWRRTFLARFADEEGRLFLRRFYDKYRGKDAEGALALLVQGVVPGARRLATIYRSVYPAHDIRTFAKFLRTRLKQPRFPDQSIAELFETYTPARYNLHDRGYIAHVHPLELWLVHYLVRHPQASFEEVAERSADERQAVYEWLFKSRSQHAQNRRIQGLLEIEAFSEIHRSWRRLGYPFKTLTPSYACAIGASADRPAALAELVGILLNNGVRYPTVRFESLRFAAGTPYETVLERAEGRGEQVLLPEVAAAARAAMIEVVENGTAQRLKGSYTAPDGTPLVLAGKTGTGDHRREIYGRGGRLLKSLVVTRSATFAFMLGERFFGTITAYVAGPSAARYHFTSSLPVQILKSLAPTLQPVLARSFPAGGNGLIVSKG
ncbi:MAG: transglycosylase domain-containing protein [Gammaproteobacteria bacterium]